MKRILFVCTGNTCRSSMAEGLFKYLLNTENISDKYNVRSAGTSPFSNHPASDHAIKALDELKIDLKNHESKSLTKEMIKEADLIITMTRSHKSAVLETVPQAVSKVYTLKEYVWEDGMAVAAVDVVDPYGGDIETYRSCRDEILGSLTKVLIKLETEE